MENGVTEPLLCTDNLGRTVVVKVAGNRYGTDVLVNEIIGSYIAESVGLPIPEYGVCSIDEDTGNLEQFGEYGYAPEDLIGDGFFSLYYKTVPFGGKLFQKTDNCSPARVLLLDYILSNEDRHNGNLIISSEYPPKAYVIDHSHIISSSYPWTEEQIREMECENPLKKGRELLKHNMEVYDMLFRHPSFTEHNLRQEVKHMKRCFEELELGYIKNMIPSSWTKSGDDKRISFIFSYIKNRICYMDEFSEILIKERRLLGEKN